MPDPAATLSTVVTYLEMTARPAAPAPPHPAKKTAIMRAEEPTVSFYRYLYDGIGEDWLWYERRALSDEDLAGVIRDDRVEVHVLYAGGVPAGLGELDRRTAGEIELAYFGLLPEFVGRGFGGYFLRWLIDRAWTYEPDRLWLHTCDLDHPNALSVYRKAGFVPYKREADSFANPQAGGLFPDWTDRRPG